MSLTDEQKAKMRSEKFKFEESRIDLDAQLKHSRLALRKILSDPSGDYGAAKSAAKEVASNQAKLMSSKELFKAEIAFKVLTADQRKEAEMCHRVHGGHGHWGGHGPGRMSFDEESAPAQEEVASIEEEDFE